MTHPNGKDSPPGQFGPVRLAIVNDYQVIVAGLRAILSPYRSIKVVELDVDSDPDRPVDVALFDPYGQVGYGLDRIESLAKCPNVGAVAVYTWSVSEASRAAARRAGANALIAKSVGADELVTAIRNVARGDAVETGTFHSPAQGAWPGSLWTLSAKESEVLAMLAMGMPNQAIAAALFISENTVRTHLKAVFRKLSVKNRSQAVAKALGDPSFATRHQRVYVSQGNS